MNTMIVDGILAIIDKVAGITEKVIDSEQQQQRLNVKTIKEWKEALDIAEKIFAITDKVELPKKKQKVYDKLRKRFDKND